MNAATASFFFLFEWNNMVLNSLEVVHTFAYRSKYNHALLLLLVAKHNDSAPRFV